MQEEEQFAQSAKPETLAEREEAATQLAEEAFICRREKAQRLRLAMKTPSGILLAESGLQGSKRFRRWRTGFRQLMPLLGGITRLTRR